LRPQFELPLAVLAALALKRSVRVTLTRQQMFALGYRSANVQALKLAADRDGRLVSFRHRFVGMTSQFEDFARDYVNWSSLLYRCPNSELGQRLVKSTRTRPATCGTGRRGRHVCDRMRHWNELAYAAKIDPLALRLLNYSDQDQIEDRPYSKQRAARMLPARRGEVRLVRRKPQRARCATAAS